MSTILTVGAPFQFEPSPPGPGGPRPIYLSSAFNNRCALFNDGTLKLLMMESFGYSVLELSNPASPQVIKWDYMPSTQGMYIAGDGQSYIARLTASHDGQRTAFSCNGPGEQWNTVFGTPDGSGGFTIQGQSDVKGDLSIRKYGSRYICYHLGNTGFWATDITSLPGTPLINYSGNMPLDTIYSSEYSGGVFMEEVGKYAIWSQTLGKIRIVDLSNPGSIGSIGAAFKTVEIDTSAPYFGGRIVGNPRGWYDDVNNKIWLLVALRGRPGVSKDAYGLFTIVQDPGTGNFGAPIFYGVPFEIPGASGESWFSDFSSSLILPKNGSIILLCAVAKGGGQERGYYAFTTDTWGTPTDYVSVDSRVFSSAYNQFTTKDANSIYQYSTGGAAYVTEFGFSGGAPPPPPTPPPAPPPGDTGVGGGGGAPQTATFPLVVNYGVEMFMSGNGDALFKGIGGGTPISVITDATTPYYEVYINKSSGFSSLSRLVVGFDTSSLGKNVTITSAKLQLYGYNFTDASDTTTIDIYSSNAPSSLFPFVASPLSQYGNGVDPSAIDNLYNSSTTKIGYLGTSSFPTFPTLGYPEPALTDIDLNISSINTLDITKFVVRTGIDSASAYPIVSAGLRIAKHLPPPPDALDSIKLIITYTGTPGATTPTPPTNVVATQFNSTTATVSWAPPTSSGSSPITEYNIVTHDILADSQTGSLSAVASARSISIAGLVADRAYDFYVFAKNANGSGGVGTSNNITLTTGTPPPPPPPPPPPGGGLPGAPTNITGVPGIGTVSLAWNTPTSDGGAAITGYKVSYTTSGFPERFLSVGAVTNALMSGLSNNTTYLVKVAAINSAGTGVYSVPSSFVTSSQQSQHKLTSWPYFDGAKQSFSIEFNEIVPQFNGITAISRDNTPATLYTTPTEVYPAYEEIGKITLRSAKRKKDPTTNNGITDYYLPPGNTVVSADLQNLSYNLNICGLGLFTAPQPDAGYLQEILKFSGRPGDVYKIYTKYQSYFQGPSAFATEHGLGGATEWKFNRITVPPAEELMPGWAFDYTHTRPFLRFDTRNLVETNTVTKAVLSFKKDPNCPIVNPENVTLSFVKVSDTVDDNNLTSADYSKIETTILTVLPLSDPTLLSGDTVSLTILDTSFIKPYGFSKIAVVTQFENDMLPTDWTQVTLQDVTLDLTLDTSSTTTPGEVSYINAFAGDRHVSLEWGAPQINGGTSIISYTITNTNTGETVQIPAVALQDNYTHDWLTLTNDTLYTFLITASNNKGTGQGTTVAATPSATPVLPGPVRYLSAHPKDGAALISWYPPTQSGSSAITAYYATNQVTGIVLSALVPNTSLEFSGLNNGTTYTITVMAQNASGGGPESMITVVPTNGIATPARPTIANVYAANGSATIHWHAPTDTGGSPLTGWIVTLFVPASPTFVPVVWTLQDPTQTSLNISSLSGGNVYLLSVSAVNIAGIGVAAFSDLFTVSPYVKPEGVFVPTHYNYKKFFEAPVDLNSSSPTYLENLYPEDDEFYATHSSAYVQSDPTLTYPIVLSPSFSTLYLSINTPITNEAPASYLEYTLPLVVFDTATSVVAGVGIMTPEQSAEQINLAAAAYNVPIVAAALEGQRVSVRTQTVGDGATISLNTNRAQLNSANKIVFGDNPTFAEGYTEYPVKGHVPTPQYDATHKKALVESRPWITVRNYDASRASLWYQQYDEHKGNCYDITLERNLRPNGVALQYFDSNNNLITLKDYLGDGRLLYREKASTGPGDPVIFTYPGDVIQAQIDPSSSDTQLNNFGLINYTTGVITKLVFPTFTLNTGALNPTFKQAFILGNKVTWPLYFKDDMTLYIDVNGITQQFVITKNPLFNAFGVALPPESTVYAAQDVADILKAKPAFRYAGLDAGVSAGQLWVRNVGNSGAVTNLPINVGPTNTLVLTPNDSQFLDTNGNIKSCNKMVFGIAPKQSPTSKVYFTYSYTNSDTSPYRYIWYQTPHFVLRSAIGPTQFTTKGHLDYLLNKLALFKPATTTLDNIEFVPSFEEKTTIKDELVLYAGGNVSLPYIQVNNRPPVSTEMAGVVVGVSVRNPDEQEDSLPDSYTYL